MKIDPSGNPVSEVVLMKAVCTLNSRIRSNGLSSKEMFTRRDQTSGSHLNFSDKGLSDAKHSVRVKNHAYSSKSKARGSASAKSWPVNIGDLVYLKDEGSKFQPRESYIIVDERESKLLLQKISKSGLLSSKQYWVPKNKVFPINNSKMKEKRTTATTYSSDSDTSASEIDCIDEAEAQSDAVDTDNDSVDRPVDTFNESSRPVRQRRRPDYYGTVKDPATVDPSTYNDTIDNWSLGWGQERTRQYIANRQQESSSNT